ncbi:AroM family protein [Pyramidobacter sp. SM-530-WT-4B]|uniref:AroM family protein n=1 Tax=Pyramidobacter porci TaxID=2605789 RepID=A0A6L5YBT0_9BACT|nr:AroM family protein [Pyramidobacter porci]MCI6259685.1 AroM family protein [Pyramidobacter sp.]MST55700.1 AroM family protein [Pyramidobacter porci]
MTLRVGAVTIGQTPRVDVTPDLMKILGPEVELVESGALDGLGAEQIAAMAPRPGDYVLVTRMADGTSVKICERAVTPLVRQKIAAHFTAGIPAVLLLCTGEFPDFPTGGLLLRPQKILFNMVQAVVPAGAKLGVFMPSPDQLEQSSQRWSQVTPQNRSIGASPYVRPEETIPAAAEELARWGADVFVMDCMGYTLAMKEQVRRITGKPVVLARSIAARALRELV